MIPVKRLKRPSAALNWQALKGTVLRYFRELRAGHPDWFIETIYKELDLPKTALVKDLAAKAGFLEGRTPTPDEVCAVARLCIKGARTEQEIADNLGISIEKVQAVFEGYGLGYGVQPYGISPYGGNKSFSDGKKAVPRRVSMQGQLSYRGHMYTMGRPYRGRNVRVLEDGQQLHVAVNGGPTIRLARRQYTPR